jgi:hypothetical protein
MKFIRMFAIVGFAVLLCAAFTQNARAGVLDGNRTKVTFSEPVEIPGLVLPAGTYVFEQVEGFQHVVRILSADETHVYATLETVSEQLPNPVAKTTFTFEERTAGAPEAIQSWFYPGSSMGEEFLYWDRKRAEVK